MREVEEWSELGEPREWDAMGVTVKASTDAREGATGFGHRGHLVTPMGEGVASEE